MHPQVLEALLKVVVVVPADPEDPCMVNEAEGECKIDRLKQQIDLPGPQVGKPASAVVASQTMVMITRLQIRSSPSVRSATR